MFAQYTIKPEEVREEVDAARALSIAEHDLARRDGVERRAHVDLDAALRQLARGVVAEPRRDLRQDLSAPRRPAPSAAGRRGAPGSNASRRPRGRSSSASASTPA